jgi:MoxR-like ATPase
MTSVLHRFHFIGQGSLADLSGRISEIMPWDGLIGPWRRHHADAGVIDDNAYPNHPANYRADPDLADAVNTAIALSKPLLLTGNPGTGKSQLSERIAWEFNIGPVLRFEAQSLSEANDLFYRFDLIGHLAAVEMYKAATKRESKGDLADHFRNEDSPLKAERFVKLGPLGEAIVRSNPKRFKVLFNAVFGPLESADQARPRQSVVLIDEIDKASRDFPNDLLNGIERLEFRIRELGLEMMEVDSAQRPIVIITSNSERDLPAPFLRRCTFFHIKDPSKEELRRIVAQRFFSTAGPRAAEPELPPFYLHLLDAFWSFREQHENELQYRPGTSELIDWTAALLSRREVDAKGDVRSNMDLVRQASSSVSKHKEDQQALQTFLKGFGASTA